VTRWVCPPVYSSRSSTIWASTMMVLRNNSRCLRSREAHSIPAETLAAMASARMRSSSLKGSWKKLRSRWRTPSLRRGVRSNTHSTDDIAPSAMLCVINSFSSCTFL